VTADDPVSLINVLIGQWTALDRLQPEPEDSQGRGGGIHGQLGRERFDVRLSVEIWQSFSKSALPVC
jgi:hypothetical protein